ncbi:hypothetical protein GCM10025868_33010 [Angustibacter aerolatus]|uniref:Uncharacterized protein n=1 Tax=Angustibacter aerolatus TaxID=1162965 RepID=A0ABQ6JKG5_9ACTN|nr:hypothetical protein GCM10025868_33010 [Angustibacter aerolatus]
MESADMLEEMLAWCDDVLEHGGVEPVPDVPALMHRVVATGCGDPRSSASARV